MIPYLPFHRDVTNEDFQRLVRQLKPWGVPCFAYPRRDHLRHLETRGEKGYYVGSGTGPSIDRAYLWEENAGALKQFRHAPVPPAWAQKHAMRFHLFDQEAKLDVDPLYVRTDTEVADEEFCVHDRDKFEQAPHFDEPFMKELRNLHMLNSVRAEPPNPTGAAVAVCVVNQD